MLQVNPYSNSSQLAQAAMVQRDGLEEELCAENLFDAPPGGPPSVDERALFTIYRLWTVQGAVIAASTGSTMHPSRLVDP